MTLLLLLACNGANPGTPTPEPATEGRHAAAHDWTSGVVEVRRDGAPVVVMTDVEGESGGDFDRVVFTFDGNLPGYHVEYVDEPVLQCGSGEPTEIAGDGWLEVRFTPSAAHTEAGEPTIAFRQHSPGLPVALEIERTCDFEAVVTWVIGTASPNRYRVQELLDPQRVVVEIQH